MSEVWIGIDGPLSPTGRLPAVWVRRAIHRVQCEGGVELTTYRQAEVVWVGMTHLLGGHEQRFGDRLADAHAGPGGPLGAERNDAQAPPDPVEDHVV